MDMRELSKASSYVYRYGVPIHCKNEKKRREKGKGIVIFLLDSYGKEVSK